MNFAVKAVATLAYIGLVLVMIPHPWAEFLPVIISAGVLYGTVMGGYYD